MEDPDKLVWPPRKSDLVMICGLAIIVYTLLEHEWAATVFGVALVLAGFCVPRMRGPFSVGAPSLQFKGELVDPATDHRDFRGAVVDQSSAANEAPRRQTAAQELPPPPAPPASSLPPAE